jgi:hypothetical protein
MIIIPLGTRGHLRMRAFATRATVARFLLTYPAAG